ncbi:MAG: cytochrome c [Acidobacteriaceae bacterium]|nr:cytochrome c [Acidobacteriaceae bacterium]
MTNRSRQLLPPGGLSILLLTPALALAHDPVSTSLTWTREISRIFAQRCQSCHREAGPAPMALTTFAEAKPWAVAIKEAVLTRQMPPWPAAKGFGEFAHDLSLTQEEIVRIAEWVEGGAPEGDPAFLKPPNVSPAPIPAALPRGDILPLRPGQILFGPTTILALRIDRPGKLWTAATPLVWGLRPSPRWLLLREPLRLPAGARLAGTGAATALVRR